MQILQITIAGTNTPQRIIPLSQGGIANAIFFQYVVFQNNSGHNIRLGDSTVSSTKGILLNSGGSETIPLAMTYSGTLNEWWVNGTAADLLDILYIP